MDLLLANPALRTRLGQNGHGYVRTEYTWNSVLERFARSLATWRLLKQA